MTRVFERRVVVLVVLALLASVTVLAPPAHATEPTVTVSGFLLKPGDPDPTPVTQGEGGDVPLAGVQVFEQENYPWSHVEGGAVASDAETGAWSIDLPAGDYFVV